MAAVVRIRGLPYSAKPDDIIEFFKDVKIKGGKRGILFPQGPNGRSNGEAFVELESTEELEKATAHHNEHIGRRYIEVFPSTKQEMNNALGKSGGSQNRREYVVRLRGLPYDTEKKEIYAFFNGLDIAPNGIGLLVDHMGRCTGEAYVQFTSSEMLARAKEKHMEKIGHRYIEIFESSMLEANSTIQRQMEANRRSSDGNGPIVGRASREGYPYSDGGFYGGPRPYDSPRGSYGNSGTGPRGPHANSMIGGPNGPYGRGALPSNRPGPYQRPSYTGHSGYGSPPRNGPPGYFGPASKGSGFGPMSNPEPEDSQSFTGHSVRLRGLPFSATVEDIERFLTPLQPINVRLRMNANGRPTGEAMVDFASHDEAKEAMKKDREKIGSRYIELFLVSTPLGSSYPVCPAYGSRSPPYGGSGRSMRADESVPYSCSSDYGIDDMYGPYPLYGTEYSAMGPAEGPYIGSNGMGPSGDGYQDYRQPYRKTDYRWP